MEKNKQLRESTLYEISLPDKKRIGEKIAFFRKERGISRKDLSEALDLVDERSLWLWETGKKLPELEHFKSLCKILGVIADDLIA